MYAVIKTSGKQHRVIEGEILRVEKLDASAGDTITLDEVLLVKKGDDLQVGSPHVKGAKVSIKVLSHGRGRKLNIFTYKRRKNLTRRMGHRQPYTEIEITSIATS
jgi:large subunit ribosomal protein L21